MSELAERATSAGKTHSIELIFFPILILVIIGVIANNYQATGLQTTPTLINPCQSLAICYPTNTNGCDNNVQNCNLTSNSTFSFLDKNSPWSLMLSGNVLGFFNCLTGCVTLAPVTNLILLSNCTNVQQPSANTGEFIQFLQCTGATFNSNAGNPPVLFYNATSQIGNNSNWLISGFTPFTTTQVGTFLNLYMTYIKNGSSFSSKYCDAVGICYNTQTYTCGTATNTHFAIQYCLIYVVRNQASPNFSSTFAVFSFISGIILLFLGFGLTIAFQILGTGTTLGINDQASRMCQVFGLGLLVWGFIYSEFGGWLNNLPFNLASIGFLSFTFMFFAGLYWRLFSLD